MPPDVHGWSFGKRNVPRLGLTLVSVHHTLDARRSVGLPDLTGSWSATSYAAAGPNAPASVQETALEVGMWWPCRVISRWARGPSAPRGPAGDRGMLSAGQEDVGLDHYQVRGYQAWYRHITSSVPRFAGDRTVAARLRQTG